MIFFLTLFAKNANMRARTKKNKSLKELQNGEVDTFEI